MVANYKTLEEFQVDAPEEENESRWTKAAKITAVTATSITIILIIIAVAFSIKKINEDGAIGNYGCDTFSRPALFLIKLDGFKPEYLKKGLAPTISKLARTGVLSKGMISQFPSVTFPNLYSIDTGLYPTYHGIVNNVFLNGARNLSANFTRGFRRDSWWLGEPMWITAKKQNVKSAVFGFMPKDSPEDRRPDYFVPSFGKEAKFDTIVDQALKWLGKDPSSRPYFITLYFDQPDMKEHEFGPDTPQSDIGVKQADDAVARILHGVQRRGLTSCTDFIIVSDHGFSKIPCSKALYLSELIPTKDVITTTDGPFVALYTKNKAHTEKLMKILSCKSDKFHAFSKDGIQMPKRYHYYSSRRLADIILVPEPSWTIYDQRPGFCPKNLLGDHGYDSIEPSMRALFIGNGPSFQRGLIADEFPNTEVYNLMAEILRVKPAPNNGSYGSLSYVLRKGVLNNTYYKKNSHAEDKHEFTKSCTFPKNLPSAIKSCADCICPDCAGDIKNAVADFRKNLNISKQQTNKSVETHMPWGIPKGGAGETSCILTQKHYVIGYSRYLRIPLWVAYKLSGEQLVMNIATKSCFRRDIRLKSEESSSCADYYNSGYQRGQLAPTADFMFNRSAEQDTYILSNAVPQNSNFSQDPGLWFKAEKMFRHWGKNYSPVFVISGSIFDYNGDGYRDRDNETKRWVKNRVAIPTHFYKIIIRCNTTEKARHQVNGCRGVPEALSFIFPHNEQADCKLREWTKQMLLYITSIKDIETLTGSEMFPQLPHQFAAEFKSKIPTKLWPISMHEF